jgi:hypothetical protein
VILHCVDLEEHRTAQKIEKRIEIIRGDKIRYFHDRRSTEVDISVVLTARFQPSNRDSNVQL